jgi:hypothetical protein
MHQLVSFGSFANQRGNEHVPLLNIINENKSNVSFLIPFKSTKKSCGAHFNIAFDSFMCGIKSAKYQSKNVIFNWKYNKIIGIYIL